MARFTGNLSEVSPNTAQISPPQPQSSDVAFLGDLANKAVEGYKVGTTASLLGDLQQAEQEFVESAQAELSFEETEELNTFSRRVKSLERKAKASNRTSEFKIRAEALLKERMNAFPGLSSHYRQAASGFLGFNPLGSEASAMEAALRAQASDAQSQLEFIDKDAVKRFNIAPGAVLSDPLAQLEYQAGLAAEAEKDDLVRAATIAERQFQLGGGQWNSPKYLNMIGDVADNSYSGVNNLVKAQLATMGIPRDETATGVTAKHLESITPEQLIELRASIEFNKATEVAKQLSAIQNAPQQVRDNAKARLEAPYDRALALLSSKSSLEEYENRSKIINQRLLNGMRGNPTIDAANAFTAIGQRIPDALATQVSNFLLTEHLVNTDEATATQKTEAVTRPENREGLSYTIENIKKQMDARFSAEVPEELDQELLDSTALNLYEAYGENGDAIPREVFSDFFAAHAGAEDYINQLKQTSPLFTPEITEASVRFSERALRDAQVKTAQIIDKYTQSRVLSRDKRGRATVREDILPFEMNVDDGGFLSLEINPQLQQVAPELL